MRATDSKPVSYRWVVLGLSMLVNCTIQMLWIAYAPITSVAEDYYHASATAVGMFSMIFMAAFIPLSLPASWLIDTKGIRFAVGLGAMLAGIGGISRGLVGDNYALAMISTFVIASAQPLLLNAWAAIAGIWHPLQERATATSLLTLASFVGTGIGMVVTPELAKTSSIAEVQLHYGIAAMIAAILFVVFARSRPKSSLMQQEPALMLTGVKHAFSVKPFLFLLGVVFVLMGVFNGMTTWIEQIVAPRGLSPDQAGLIGAVMLLTGIIGAVVLSSLSDRVAKRVPFIVTGTIGSIPGLLLIAFAPNFALIMVGAAVLGFFLTATIPIGIQYAAELTAPTPEGTSNGIIQLFAQGSVVVVFAMELFRTQQGDFTPGLVGLCAALLLSAIVMWPQKEAIELHS